MKMINRINTDPKLIKDILAKALTLEILSLKEVSTLISLQDNELWEEVFETARLLKEKVYGSRIVLFAPLYLSNVCVNDCIYCGFRKDNKKARRKSLDPDEAVAEAALLAGKGYKRLLLVTSEHPKLAGLDYLEKVIHKIYKKTDIRILHINTAPVDVEDFKRLKACGVGVYQCFQETYHIPTYMYMHPSGPKADYEWRLDVMDRAIKAGFEDVGMGVLLGLYEWQWDVWALIAHSHRLIKKYGFGPHTISVPRLQHAEGAKLKKTKYKVSDSDFKKIVALCRLALPYVGIVISTRESPKLRDKLFFIGASQVSAGSRTSPQGYIEGSDTAQFEVCDKRNLEDVIRKIAVLGLIPSLCTACYRKGRSGERFMHLAQKETMKSLCQENALLTLKEYIEDFASNGAKKQLIKRLKEETVKSSNGLFKKFISIEKGKRDIHV